MHSQRDDMCWVAKPSNLPPPDAKLVVVEASAGTGKTFFLEHRVVDLLIEQNATLPQILVVTFTEKATAELRRRIRDIVDTIERSELSADDLASDAPLWRVDSSVRKRLAAARAEFGQAAIFTIHGFCQRMLVEDAFTAGRLFEQQRVADEAAFERAFYSLLREELACEPHARALLQRYLEGSGSVEELFKVMLGCARKSHCEMRQAPTADRLLQARDTIVSVHANNEWTSIAARIKTSPSRKAADTRWVNIVERLLVLPQVASDGAVFDAADGCIGDALWLLGGTAAEAIASSPQLVAALATLATSVSLEAFLVAQWLPRALERMAAAKAELAQFDYQDLLNHLWEALNGPGGERLASSIRTKFPWALIDEFQDTDDVQWNIFRRIWLHDDARGLTIVGDPKQSIYSFRGADVEVYLKARRELLQAGACEVVLSENQRSTRQVVDAVNLLLGVGTISPMFDSSVTYETPSKASGRVVASDDGPAVTVLCPPGIVKGRAKSNERVMFGAAIADEIEKLLAQPPTWIERGVTRVVGACDIMVLTRSSDQGDAMAQLLSARGVSTSRVQQERLFVTQEARELRDIFEAIERPRDRAARLRALRSRFFAVPWNQVAELGSVPDHHPLYALLTHWQRLADLRRFDSLFHSLVEDSGLATRTIALGAAERVLVNTQHVLDLLAESTAARPMEFHEVCELLRSWIASGETSRDDELDVQKVETDGDAVQIMTVHRAKGLEAAVVFLYGGDRPPPTRSRVATFRQDGRRKLAVGKKHPAPIQALIDTDIDQENRRLLYVAMTRAKLRLYLCRYTTLPDLAAFHYLVAPLHALVNQIGKAPVSSLLRLSSVDEPASTIAIADGSGNDSDSDEVNSASSVASEPVVKLLRSLELPQVEEFQLALGPFEGRLPRRQTHGELLSYSKLSRQAYAMAAASAVATSVVDSQLVLHKELGDESSSDSPLDPDQLPPGAESGLFVHDLLEQTIKAMQNGLLDASVHASAFSTYPLIRDIAQRAAAKRNIVLPGHIDHGLRMAHRMLNDDIVIDDNTSLPPLIRAQQLASEVEFWFPASDDSTVRFVRGSIDAIASWNARDLWIVDYKTDSLGDSLATIDILRQRAQLKIDDKYGLQAAVYTEAVTRMITADQRIAGTLFCFVRYGIFIQVAISSSELNQVAQRWRADSSNAGERSRP
jgi:exodeoxyribonuclease V beta subunit